METQVKHLKLKRLSSVPNKNGSYAFQIVNAEDPAVAELLEQVGGVYDGREEGTKILYSRNRIGQLGVARNVAIRLNESRTPEGEGTGNFYINLVDTGVEAAGEFFDKVKLAEQFGVKNSAAAVAAFYGTKGTAIPAATAVEAEEPATTEGAKAETPLQNAGA